MFVQKSVSCIRVCLNKLGPRNHAVYLCYWEFCAFAAAALAAVAAVVAAVIDIASSFFLLSLVAVNDYKMMILPHSCYFCANALDIVTLVQICTT